jgi:hypothetical protein
MDTSRLLACDLQVGGQTQKVQVRELVGGTGDCVEKTCRIETGIEKTNSKIVT